jgi:hypothetical protein
MDIQGWLIISGIGILFGIFPAWWWCSALIADAIVQKRTISKWLTVVAESVPLFGVIHSSLFNKKIFLATLRISSIIWVTACFFIYFFFSVSDFRTGNITLIIGSVTSFPIFLTLTLIIPIYFLKRYLKQLS